MAESRFGKCEVCGNETDLEGHHIIPISYGGPKDGKLVNLCESCHFRIHKTAESILAKTVKNKNWFNSLELLKKASPYIQAIIQAKRDYQDGKTNRNIPRRHLIVVELSDNEWSRIKKVQKDKGFSNLNLFFETILRGLIKF